MLSVLVNVAAEGVDVDGCTSRGVIRPVIVFRTGIFGFCCLFPFVSVISEEVGEVRVECLFVVCC